MSPDPERALNSDKRTTARAENRWHHVFDHHHSFSMSTKENAKAGRNVILQTECRMPKERWTWPVRTLSSWTTIQQDGRIRCSERSTQTHAALLATPLLAVVPGFHHPWRRFDRHFLLLENQEGLSRREKRSPILVVFLRRAGG